MLNFVVRQRVVSAFSQPLALHRWHSAVGAQAQIWGPYHNPSSLSMPRPSGLHVPNGGASITTATPANNASSPPIAPAASFNPSSSASAPTGPMTFSSTGAAAALGTSVTPVSTESVDMQRNLLPDASNSTASPSVSAKVSAKAASAVGGKPSETVQEPQEEKALFGSARMSASLLRALGESNITQPSEIQRLVIPEILAGRDVLFAAQTGTGKTLAFLLPIFDMLQRDEREHSIMARIGRPRAMVLVPTRELAVQVGAVAKFLAHFCRLKVRIIYGGVRAGLQNKMLNQPVDLLIATPGRCKELHSDKHLHFSDVRYVVVDEADTMFEFGTGFAPLVRDILFLVGKRSGNSSQHVLVSASVHPRMQDVLLKEFPRAKFIATKQLHRTISSLQESFITLRGGQNKLDVLVEILAGNAPSALNRNSRAHSNSQQPKRNRFSDESSSDADDLPVGLSGLIRPQSDARDSKNVSTAPTLVKLGDSQFGDEEADEADEDEEFELSGDEVLAEHDELTAEDGAEEERVSTQLGKDWKEAANDEGYDLPNEIDWSKQVHMHISEQHERVYRPVAEPTMVFCNTVPSARAVEHYLSENGFKTTNYHGSIPPQTRTKNFGLFMKGDVPIMVCTDVAARGLDTTFVKHVILFDFPLTPIDYIHRVGRTARFGTYGRATSLITKGDRILAEAIRRSRTAGTPIHTLSSDKASYAEVSGHGKKPARKTASSRFSSPARSNRSGSSGSESDIEDEADAVLFRRRAPVEKLTSHFRRSNPYLKAKSKSASKPATPLPSRAARAGRSEMPRGPSSYSPRSNTAARSPVARQRAFARGFSSFAAPCPALPAALSSSSLTSYLTPPSLQAAPAGRPFVGVPSTPSHPSSSPQFSPVSAWSSCSSSLQSSPIRKPSSYESTDFAIVASCSSSSQQRSPHSLYYDISGSSRSKYQRIPFARVVDTSPKAPGLLDRAGYVRRPAMAYRISPSTSPNASPRAQSVQPVPSPPTASAPSARFFSAAMPTVSLQPILPPPSVSTRQVPSVDHSEIFRHAAV